MKRKLKFSIVISTMPGWDLTGKFTHRGELEDIRFKTKHEAISYVNCMNLVSYDYRHQWCVYVVKHVPGIGWKLMEKFDTVLIEDEE